MTGEVDGDRAIRIPKDFEFEGDEATIRKDGDRLIVEPVRKGSLLEILAGLEPLAEPVDREYAVLRASLKRRGSPIGPNNLLIAAHALAHGAVLVTANRKEFSRVDGLAIENWLDASAQGA